MTRVRTIAPLLVAVVLAAVAVLTVVRAGCPDPGRFEAVAGGYQLVGGCLRADDLVVPAPAAPQTPPSSGMDAARS